MWTLSFSVSHTQYLELVSISEVVISSSYCWVWPLHVNKSRTLLLLPMDSDALPPLLPNQSVSAVARTRLTRGGFKLQHTYKTQNQQLSITHWRAPVPRCTQKTMGKRDWNPLPAASASIAWLAPEVCCSKTWMRTTWPSAQAAVWLAGYAGCGQHVPIFRLFGAGWYTPAQQLYPAAWWRGEEGSHILPAHKFSLRFSLVGEMSKAYNFLLLEAHCKKA